MTGAALVIVGGLGLSAYGVVVLGFGAGVIALLPIPFLLTPRRVAPPR
jgi:hypothetical protein